MTVLIDGATLSRLLFNYLNNLGSQYGLLLGEKVNHVEDRISDSQIHTSNVDSFFCISSFLPWPNDEHMYSRSGCINEDCLQRLLANTEQSVVGWYSFRHKSAMRPSLREITLHKNLASGGKFDGSPEEFLFFLCTSSYTSSLSTFSCNHAFMHLKQGRFVEVPVTILNLGDTTRKEYRKRSNATLSHCRTVNETMHKARGSFVRSSDEMDQVVRVNHLAASLNKGLETVHSKLTQSEGTLGLLEAEVDSLRERLRQLEQQETHKRLAEEESRRRHEERQERVREDEAAEAEEKQQMERLLQELGLTTQGGEMGESSRRQEGSFTEASAGAVGGVAESLPGPVWNKDSVEKHGLSKEKSAQSKGLEVITNLKQYDSVKMECQSIEKTAHNQVEVDEIEKLSGSSSDESTSSTNDLNQVNGQKTYSTIEPVSQKKKDPFDFLDTELHRQKKSLAQPQLVSQKSKGKSSAPKFCGLSHSVKNNVSIKHSKKKEPLSNNALNSDSIDEAGSNSSNGVYAEEEAANSIEILDDDIDGSPPQNETYVISASPTF